VTHNSARVTRKYLRAVPDSKRSDDLSVGDLLRTSPIYLSQVLDELLVLGSLVALDTWRRLEDQPDEDVFGQAVVSASYELLQQGRWDAASHFCSCALKNLKISDGFKLLLLCNRWIAEKHRERPELDVQAQVSEWSVGHLSKEFSVAKAALLDDFQALPGLVREAVVAGDMAVWNLRSWPLFRKFRETDGFLPLLTELEKDLEPLKVIVEEEEEDSPQEALDTGGHEEEVVEERGLDSSGEIDPDEEVAS
jgi:hypothetical protein